MPASAGLTELTTIELFERAAKSDPSLKASVDHQVALALAGRARVKFEAKDHEGALAEILASFARAPRSAGTRDGLGFKPGEMGQILLASLKQDESDESAAKLTAALEKLDPELLVPDK